jgi:hypothetical protein
LRTPPPPCRPPTIHRTDLRGLEKIYEGKVRDLYRVDEQFVLMVATDRLSAFDVVLPDPIPDKGRVLNAISNFWFAKTGHLVPNHLSGRPLASVVRDPQDLALLEGRAVIVRKGCRRCPSRRWCAGISSGRAGRTTCAPAACAGSHCPRA